MVRYAADMQSQVNLARIVRAAALFGVTELLVVGRGRMDRDVSLGAEDHVHIKPVRTLPHRLRRLQQDGYTIIGLEQTADAQSLEPLPRQCCVHCFME